MGLAVQQCIKRSVKAAGEAELQWVEVQCDALQPFLGESDLPLWLSELLPGSSRQPVTLYFRMISKAAVFF